MGSRAEKYPRVVQSRHSRVNASVNTDGNSSVKKKTGVITMLAGRLECQARQNIPKKTNAQTPPTRIQQNGDHTKPRDRSTKGPH